MARFSLRGRTEAAAAREARSDLRPHPALPDDTRLWAAMVEASGGIWGGCIYDVDAITARLKVAKSERRC